MIVDMHAHIIPEHFPPAGKRASAWTWPSMDHFEPGRARVMIEGENYRTVHDGNWNVERRLRDMKGHGVDVFESKLEMARRVGATHVVNSAKDDPVKAVRTLTGGAGVDHAFEAVGNTTLVRQAIESLAIRGTATIVGVLPPDAKIEFPWMAIRPECRVQTSRMGSNRFRVDIPRYLEFYRQGRLLLDEMVTRRGRLDDINEAFRAMKAGEVARTVLLFN